MEIEPIKYPEKDSQADAEAQAEAADQTGSHFPRPARSAALPGLWRARPQLPGRQILVALFAPR